MNRTEIEWADWTWNPVVGCRNGCWYCYSKPMFERFHPGEKFEDLHIYPKRFQDPDLKNKNPKKIFVGSMTDIMDSRIPIDKILYIFEIVREFKQHTFIFLTKNSTAFTAYTELDLIPESCWLGATITGEESLHIRMTRISHLLQSKARVKFISFEPLLGEVGHLIKKGIDWIIIGGMSDHPWERSDFDVAGILDSAKYFNIPVFIKDNLEWPEVRREYPIGV